MKAIGLAKDKERNDIKRILERELDVWDFTKLEGAGRLGCMNFILVYVSVRLEESN